MMLSSRIAWILIALLLLPACASPLGEEAAAPTGLPQDLGVPATVQPAPSPTDDTTKGGKRHRGKPEAEQEQEAFPKSKKGGKTKGGGGDGVKQPKPEDAGTFTGTGSVADPSGDAGLQAPAYADFTNILVESDAQSARVTVDMAGSLPERLVEGEVEGVGVDLIRGKYDSKDDYQVFASGNADGWFGYLYAPDGFTRYKGSFEVSGNRLVFTVPWSELGGERGGTFTAFCDWSGPGTIAVNPTGSDFAPDSGEATFG
ncbi:MAG: hypothetical protein ACRDH9_03815 [Actinomycetota bacterium]